MGRNPLKAIEIGEYAVKDVISSQAGQVVGITSAGVFVKLENGGLLFLTENPRRGPITVNLAPPWPGDLTIRMNEPVRSNRGEIHFSETGMAIQTAHLAGWRPPRLSFDDRTSNADQRSRLDCLANRLLAARPGCGLNGLLSCLVAGAPSFESNDLEKNLRSVAVDLQIDLVARDPGRASDHLSPFIGYGSGLTPSGDDFILGILLLLNRWHALEWDGQLLDALNGKILEAAHRKTTSLSARLVECATLGAADEFLIQTADYLMASTGTIEVCLEGLLGWGSSSGIDTLTGMALIIMAEDGTAD
ncbi:MAG TPA: DUF2877 domain-containing protein [Anaerolineaceae bacterium]|nr:DUF2877 domain-containing protein [Anaerolineaceae bacterium]